MDIFTLSTTDPLAITQPDGVYRLSVKASGGTVDLSGNLPTFKGLATTAVTLTDGQAVVLEAHPQKGIACTITPGTGSADIIICFN